jgi:hypothetical protein
MRINISPAVLLMLPPGNSKLALRPEEIERGIVLAIEDAISGLEGIDEISSSAQEGYATVLPSS